MADRSVRHIRFFFVNSFSTPDGSRTSGFLRNPIAPTTWVWCHKSGNLSPVHIPILLQRYRSTDRDRTCTARTTIWCSAIKLQRTSGMRDSNSHGITPGDLLGPRIPVPAIPLKCTKRDSNSQARTGTASLALRVYHSATGA